MKTTHTVKFENSTNMGAVPSESVNLVVTSPPYPMIEMWDDIFSRQSFAVKEALKKQDGPKAFELMNKVLDPVWDEVFRILKPGGFACINIGDATRTVNGNFMLYPNHSRILTHMLKLGFTSLPVILWRKQTNAPNKFMGSGMLPAGAYVTLEHEYILILRKGAKRIFTSEKEKQNRRLSAIFWEERNNWFSDVWMDLKGTVQKLTDKTVRKRSGAFPFELPYRLINMYSAKGDTVVDPFFGIGTTMIAAMAACRNSIGFEIDAGFRDTIFSRAETALEFSNAQIKNRMNRHFEFIEERLRKNGGFKHENIHYKFPVITNQEKELLMNQLISVKKTGDNSIDALYADTPQKEYCKSWENCAVPDVKKKKTGKKKTFGEKIKKAVQLELI
ncbi:MAG: site-specific DNA-methyltransferase [Desulfobacterales bacterium]|nr:site-specific DNA-methyltransferase [Desulfobacterales bacterium]